MFRCKTYIIFFIYIYIYCMLPGLGLLGIPKLMCFRWFQGGWALSSSNHLGVVALVQFFCMFWRSFTWGNSGEICHYPLLNKAVAKEVIRRKIRILRGVWHGLLSADGLVRPRFAPPCPQGCHSIPKESKGVETQLSVDSAGKCSGKLRVAMWWGLVQWRYVVFARLRKAPGLVHWRSVVFARLRKSPGSHGSSWRKDRGRIL